VVFLSMVDVPEGQPLPLSGATELKQRYNVAASRAAISCAGPLAGAQRDLQMTDLRRRLIEQCRPEGMRPAETTAAGCSLRSS